MRGVRERPDRGASLQVSAEVGIIRRFLDPFILTRKGWRNLAVTGMVVAAILGGWAAISQRARQPKTVLVIIVDTLRQDALGSYGNPHRPTPFMDALASEGVRFDQAISTSGWTLPAVASLLTGAWPTVHGATGKGTRLTPIRDEFPTAAEIFKTAGFNTFGFANAAFLSPMLGLDRGFDVFDHRHAYNWDVRRADETVDAALAHIRKHRHESNFVLVHLFDPHLDYDPPPGHVYKYTGGRENPPPPLTMQQCMSLASDGQPPQDDKKIEPVDPPSQDDIAYIKGVYLGEVNFVDLQIGRLLDAMKEMGIYDQATVVVTSDHGEEFWEHGGFEHGHTLYDELIRVPLLVKLPLDWNPSLSSVTTQVRILDVMPTLFDLHEIQTPETFVGTSLLPLIMGEDEPDRPAFSESTLYGSDRLSWRTGRYKYIFDLNPEAKRRAELYDLRVDPREMEDLLSADPEIAQELYEELGTFYSALLEKSRILSKPKVKDMTPDQIERLRSLGYIR